MQRGTAMSESKRIIWLILVMMVAVTVSTLVAITVLYDTSFEELRLHLIQHVGDQIHLMEAAARNDRSQTKGDMLASENTTLSQIRNAFAPYPNVDHIAEITVARHEGENIVYLVTHGRMTTRQVEPIPFASGIAEPMRRALSGQSGSMIGLDYRGVKVLAAYQPVPLLHAGVVAKMDLADIRAPFIRGAVMVIGLALLLVSVGTLLFVRLTSPIVRHLTETEQRYQRLFSSVPVPIWDQDCSGVEQALQGLRRSGVTSLETHLAEHPKVLTRLLDKVRIKEANAAALRLFAAHSDRQFIAWFEQYFVPVACEGAASELLQALWAGQEALLSRTLGIRTLDGRELSVLLCMAIPPAGNGYRSIPVAMLDLTADLKLSRREEELDLILASTGEGLYGMDNSGRCIFINRAALQMLGFPDENDLLGRDMHALIHPDCPDDGAAPVGDCPIYRACQQNAVVLLDDVELVRADRSRFSATYRSYPMLRDGTMVGTVVSFNDITERKERDAQHLHAQKMEAMGQLTGGIAHDFNNLLAIILTNLRMLGKQFAGRFDAEIDELMEDTLSAAEDGAELTARLLAFSRRDVRKPRLVEINRLLADYHKFLRSVTGDDIDLLVRQAEQPLSVMLDTQELANVILNLAINARDAMPTGGRLIIDAVRQDFADEASSGQFGLKAGSYLVIGVTDTGVGMSAEILQRAIEPFFTTKPAGKGSGLGLSMAFRFAQQAGGGLRIESSPGQGTRVSLYLPEALNLSDARNEPQSNQISTGLLSETKTILLVEDDPRTRHSAKRLLSELGYRVLEAENALAAIRILEQDQEIDLLFTDLLMPGGLDGRGLGYWVRRHRPDLKVLLTSGQLAQAPDTDDSDSERLPFLPKPYSQEQLEETIKELLQI